MTHFVRRLQVGGVWIWDILCVSHCGYAESLAHTWETAATQCLWACVQPAQGGSQPRCVQSGARRVPQNRDCCPRPRVSADLTGFFSSSTSTLPCCDTVRLVYNLVPRLKQKLLYFSKNYYSDFLVWILESTSSSQNNRPGPKLGFGRYDLIGQLPSLTSVILPHLQPTPETPQACDPSYHFLIYSSAG